MRIGIVAIQHESNTFVDRRTTLDDFRRDALLQGGEMTAYCRATRHEVGGAWQAIAAAGGEPVPVLLALATPGGMLMRETGEALVEMMQARVGEAGPLDGVLAAAHGAAVSEGRRDFDGWWLETLLRAVGEKTPIVGTLDPHANLSPLMVTATDALVAYRTNPHTDQFETGFFTAELLLNAVRGDVRLTQAAAFPEVAISIDRQATDEMPCRELIARADVQIQSQGGLSNSVVLGFPYADVEDIGSSFLAVTDGDARLAQAMADEMAADLTARRKEFACHLPGVDEAVQSVRRDEGRVCLLDVGDNVGGGAAGDGTMLARRLAEEGIGPAVVCLWDAEAAKTAGAAGVGGQVRLAMGGKVAREQGNPLEAEVRVRWVGDAAFEEAKAVHGGRNAYTMGRTAVVETEGGMTVVLTSERVPPFSLGQLTCCGLDPRAFRVLVVKGVNAPIAAYRDVCDAFVRVNTPGVTCADMTLLKFRHRRRPLFPFESIGP